MRDRLDEFGDAAIAIITFSAPDQVAAYQRTRLAPLPVLVDQTRAPPTPPTALGEDRCGRRGGPVPASLIATIELPRWLIRSGR